MWATVCARWQELYTHTHINTHRHTLSWAAAAAILGPPGTRSPPPTRPLSRESARPAAESRTVPIGPSAPAAV
jgi:hypothetical protein